MRDNERGRSQSCLTLQPWMSRRLVVPLTDVKFTASKTMLRSITVNLGGTILGHSCDIQKEVFGCSTDNCKYDTQARDIPLGVISIHIIVEINASIKTKKS